jgi:hypothetical protein
VLSAIAIEKRAEWIKALRSGKYYQTTGQLFESVYLPSEEGPAYSNDPQDFLYCCIGVANACLHSDWLTTCHIVSYYERFRNELSINEQISYYLMAMNDGGTAFKLGCVIRCSTASSRDFKFIARFVEILTALQSCDNVTRFSGE